MPTKTVNYKNWRERKKFKLVKFNKLGFLSVLGNLKLLLLLVHNLTPSYHSQNSAADSIEIAFDQMSNFVSSWPPIMMGI